VQLYDDTVAALLDRQAPLRPPSNAWYDDECRQRKNGSSSPGTAFCLE